LSVFHRAAGLLTGLCLGALALGPGLRRGFLLSYDMVFVPRESLSAALSGATSGAPRPVPSDLVVALASHLLPGDVVQKIVLLAIFAAACGGVAALLADEPIPARLAAGVFYAWNPFVAERLIIGQWATLLGYAGLPWVLRAVTRRPRLSTGRLVAAMVPAIIGGFAAMLITAIAGVPVVALRRSGRDALVAAIVFVIGCLPWLVPSLLHTIDADPAGIAAFAARADTPFGSFGSLLMLGGMWNAQAVPAGYGGALSVIWLVVVLAAVGGFGYYAARPPSRWPGLGIAAVAGLIIASLGITGAGRDLLRAASDLSPAFATLRDGQQFVAPLALAEALGFGLVAARLTRGRDAAAMVYGVLMLLVPVLLLPGLAWGAAGRLRPVWYPAGWASVAATIDDAPTSGDVLLLPWAPYRRPAWNHGEAVLDPWPRLLSRTVIWNDGTAVGDLVLLPEDPTARTLNPLITGTGPMSAALEKAGIRFVLVDGGPSVGGRLPGAVRLVATSSVTVFELPPARE
jgi:hypothetical protein